ncbi:hypothetical protein SSBG_06015 [Streptomyces sp. SPB074]|nr:hypothetical protein SSBG_06015 [Streptomyces sp. SPB074]
MPRTRNNDVCASLSDEGQLSRRPDAARPRIDRPHSGKITE